MPITSKAQTSSLCTQLKSDHSMCCPRSYGARAITASWRANTLKQRSMRTLPILYIYMLYNIVRVNVRELNEEITMHIAHLPVVPVF